MEMYGDIPVCGNPVDQGALDQIKRSRESCEFAALMADHHKGYGVPIGGVVASQVSVSPTAVGFDIACGNLAARVDIDAAKVRSNIKPIMDKIASQISFGVGRSRDWDLDHPLFDSPLWKQLPAFQQKSPKGQTLKDTAQEQLGTVGSGNHYVDLFLDEQDRVWIGVHFGSRGFGHKTATWFLDAVGASGSMEAAPVWFATESDLGEQYIKALDLAGQYAYAGREAVVDKVAGILGTEIVETVHNHHNFAWKEKHNGLDYWVCRKGATPAQPGQKGFVGGSMGDNAVIIEGIESEESKRLFYSTVHGAGRVMSRTAAGGKSRWGKKRSGGLIAPEDMMKWVRQKGVELRGGDVDEAPQAYKRLDEVLPQQGNTIRILHTLRPIGVAMAGHDIFDPYKD
ncbi:RtcB family protein [bacterium]|nr:MAG: RtcB family protein [bacterium]